MATISITVPDAHVTRVQDAFAAIHNYDPNGGVTLNNFVRAVIREFVVNTVKTYEGRTAINSAKTTSDASVDSIGIS